MKALSALQKVQLAGQAVSRWRSLMKRPFLTAIEIQQYQLYRVRQIVSEAKKHVPLYQTRYLPEPEKIKSLDDLQQIPVLTKADLLNTLPADYVSQRFLVSDLIVSKSSGSTGKSLDVYYDADSYNLFIAAVLRLYFMAFRYMPWHKQTYIYTSAYPISSLFGLYPLHFISTLNPIEDTIQQMRLNPPDLLVCYPSHLRSITDQMSPSDFKLIKPKVINVNSEMSSPNEREYLAKKFGAFVFDDYSSEELTRIASQCRYLNYHIFDDLNYIEILDDHGQRLPDGVVGNIVGTNLHNVGMPLIRYSQGDRGAISTKKCACGRNFRILEKLEGRKNDAFTLSTGEVMSSGFLLDLTYGVFLDFPGAVNSFCLVQDEPDSWLLELVPGRDWNTKLVEQIPVELMNHLKRPQVYIRASLVKEVRKTKSGKANPIISMLNAK